jgi:hypothetical protein
VVLLSKCAWALGALCASMVSSASPVGASAGSSMTSLRFSGTVALSFIAYILFSFSPRPQPRIARRHLDDRAPRLILTGENLAVDLVAVHVQQQPRHLHIRALCRHIHL